MVYLLKMGGLAIENGPVEIVDLPIENGGSFHSYVNVYQRVYVAIFFGRKSKITSGDTILLDGRYHLGISFLKTLFFIVAIQLGQPTGWVVTNHWLILTSLLL